MMFEKRNTIHKRAMILYMPSGNEYYKKFLIKIFCLSQMIFNFFSNHICLAF